MLNETLTRQAQKVDFSNLSGAAVPGRTPTGLEVWFRGTLKRLSAWFGVTPTRFLGYFFASIASEKMFENFFRVFFAILL